MFEQLRADYAKIERIDPSSPNYKRLIQLLDSADTPMLQKLADAQIKWVSMLARNRVTQRVQASK